MSDRSRVAPSFAAERSVLPDRMADASEASLDLDRRCNPVGPFSAPHATSHVAFGAQDVVRRRPLALWAVVVALVLLGAGCRSYKPPPEAASTSSSTAPGSPESGAPPKSTSGLPTTTSRAAPTTRPVPTTRRVEAPPPAREPGGPCLTDELRVEPVEMRPVGAALVERFRLTNVGSRGCTLTGYPSVAPYAAASMQVQVGPIPPGDGQTGAPGSTLLLGLGETAVFFVKWTPTSPPAFCQKPEGILFNAPGDNLPPTRVPFAITFCGRLLRVSAVLPAATTG